MTKDKTTQSSLELTKLFFKDMDKVVNNFYKACDIMVESIHKTEAELYILKHGQYGWNKDDSCGKCHCPLEACDCEYEN